jgi:exodeoxyribonuclease-5
MFVFSKRNKMNITTNNEMLIKTQKTVLEFLHFENPTQEQVDVLNAIETFVQSENEMDFMVVCGSAGTGKSSIMNAVVNYLHQQKTKVQICAPTARAARLISMKTNDIASTVHSLVFSVESQKETAQIHFGLKTNKDEDYTIFIIDEASMINSKVTRNHEDELFVCNNAILDAIAHYVKGGNKNNKIIFVGDRYQLAPVGEIDSNALYPNYLKNTFTWKGIEYFLNEVKRQEDGCAILKVATSIRNAIESNKEMPNLKIPSLNNTWEAQRLYVKDLEEFGPNKVANIACTTKQNQHFNFGVRTLRYGANAMPLLKNEVLTIKRNWKRNGINLNNGDTVIIKEVDYSSKEIVAGMVFVPVLLRAKNSFNQEIEIADYLLVDCLQIGLASLGATKENRLYHERYTKNKTYRETGNIENDRYLGAIRGTYGYSITCNTAQGGEWDKVYLNTFYMPDKRWAYTGITRAKQELIKY